MNKKLFFFTALLLCPVLIKAQADTLFPDMAGWKKNLIEKVYTSDDLWQLIDGAADIFLSYYFEDLHLAEYELKDEMIRVELYRHRSGDDTYGIYSAERMPDYPQVRIGTQGYKSQGVLNFFEGIYYVKIMSAGIKETDEKTLISLAEKVQSTLKQSQVMPFELGLFPEEGKVILSDSYIAQNFMGYSFFNSAFVMKYDKPAEFQLFIIHLTDQHNKMVDQYVESVNKENVTEKNGFMVVRDPFNGTVFLRIYNGYLIGAMNTENEDVAMDYISKIINKL